LPFSKWSFDATTSQYFVSLSIQLPRSLADHATRPSNTAFRLLLARSSVSLRLLSKAWLAFPRSNTGSFMVYMFKSTNICRRCNWDLTPPLGPLEALMIAAGFSSHTLSSAGRLPHSMAFFRTAVTEKLCSGLAKSTASAPPNHLL
jgi:hypothetical protein